MLARPPRTAVSAVTAAQPPGPPEQWPVRGRASSSRQAPAALGQSHCQLQEGTPSPLLGGHGIRRAVWATGVGEGTWRGGSATEGGTGGPRPQRKGRRQARGGRRAKGGCVCRKEAAPRSRHLPAPSSPAWLWAQGLVCSPSTFQQLPHSQTQLLTFLTETNAQPGTKHPGSGRCLACGCGCAHVCAQ